MPATVFRFDRCSTDDVDVIVTLYYAVTGTLGAMPAPPPYTARFLGRPVDPVPSPPPSDGNTGGGFSYGLFYHVALSEMWYELGDPAAEQVVEDWSELTMSTGLETWLAPKLDWWPRYPRDGYWGGIADYDGPLLMLQGGLDPATTAEPVLELATHFAAPGQTLAYWPQGAHGMIGGATLPQGGDCGQELLWAFLEAPEAALDLGCVARTQGVQWDGYADYNVYFMGTQDVWGD